MRKAGRPRKSALDRRATQVKVCLKLAESEQLDLFAAEAGMSVSEFLRTRALAPSPTPAIAPDLKHDVCRLLLTVQVGLRDGLSRETLATKMQAVIDRLLR